jgi:excisionase family DNA binding protein
MKERVKSKEAANILGLTKETVVRMANNGALPGAGKIGGNWTFDKEKLRKFIIERELECQKKISTYATESIGYRLQSVGSSSEDRFTQAILKLQGKSGTKQLTR